MQQTVTKSLRSLPMVASSAAMSGGGVTTLVAMGYGLGDQYSWDVVGFVLGTCVVMGSLALLACSTILWAHQGSRCLVGCIAVALGLLHGYAWSAITTSQLEVTVANFAIPFAPPWMAGSSCGFLVAAAIQRHVAHRRMVSAGPVIGSSLLLVVVFCPGLLLASCMLTLLQDDGVTQHVVPRPDGQWTAYVIRDDCGATCGCTVRVDIRTDRRYVREVFRSGTDCDAVVTWQSPHIIAVFADQQQHLRDLQALD